MVVPFRNALLVRRAAAHWMAVFTIFCISSLSAQVEGRTQNDSSLIKNQQSKPGFLSLLQEDEEAKSATPVVDSVKKALPTPSGVNATKPQESSARNTEIQPTPTITYKTFVMNEERRKLENRFGAYINERFFNISVRKIVGYEDGSYATAQSELPGVLKVVRKNLPKIVSERFEIIVDVDTSSTKGDYQFFYNLVNGIIAIDNEDIVKINFWKFPQAFVKDVPKLPSKEELMAELKAENDLSKQTAQADAVPTQIQPPIQNAPQVESENSQLEGLLERLLEREEEREERNQLPPEEKSSDTLIWAILIGLVVLAILVLLFFVFRSNNAKSKPADNVDELELSSVGLKKIAEGVFDENRPSMKKDEFKTHLLENPASVAAFLNSIIEQNNDEALTVFAHLARPFPDLVGMTKPFMSYNNFLLVLSKLDQPGDEKIDSNSIDKFLVTFNSAVKVLSNSKTDDVDVRGGKVFGFLEQLSDNQVASLLSSDKPELASVVFAQLNRDRKLSVLENIDEELRSEILISLSDIKKMPLSIIKEVGIRYSKKAREVAGLEDVKIDGLKALVETLDELDYKKQIDIIDTMRASDLEKGARLEKMFIGINGLSGIPEDSLRTALSDLQTETIIRALYGIAPEQVDYILQARPPRERELIKSEIEVQPSFTSADQISARKLVLQNVRKVVL
ncbi:MAG: FliG C-terminal domain-containing protein [Schleiferiaceae bacterium]